MKNLKPMNSKEKKEIQKILEEQYGFSEKLNYVFLFNEKEQKVFIVSNDLARIDIANVNANSVGMYFGQLYKEKFRLSIEGSQIVGPKATKNILELDEMQRSFWLKGEDMQVEAEDNFYLIKSGDDFIGTGSVSNKKLFNFVSKPRRIHDVS